MQRLIPVIYRSLSVGLSGLALIYGAATFAQAPVTMWRTAPPETLLGGGSLKDYSPEQRLPTGKVFHVDANGNSYVAGSISTVANPIPNYVTIKYDAGGNELWRTVTDGYFDDRVSALAVDSTGNVYVLGVQGYVRATNFPSTQNILLIKYNAEGSEVWRATSSLSDNALALALDAAGNAYVSGTRPQGSQITFKFSSATGEMLWNKEIASGLVNQPKTLAVDSSGNSFVVANTGVNLGNYNYVTVKYNTDGVQQWSSRLTPFASAAVNHAYALAIDANGNTFVAGTTFEARPLPSTTVEADFLVVKFDATGREIWRTPLNSHVEYSNGARSIALDNAGNIVVSGLRQDNSTYSEDFVTAKFDTAGNLLWQAVASEPGNTLEFWPKIAIDQNQNIFITGNTEIVSTGPGLTTYRGMTFKYSPNGVEEWRMLIANPASTQVNTSHAIALDSARNVYVAGNSSKFDGSQSAMTVTKYSQFGPTVPNPPIITSATVGNANVQIYFTPPVSNGGSPILQFLARCGLSNSAIGPSSPLTVPDLLPGVTYSCTVEAANALGNSAKSTPVPVLWVVAPSAPMNLTATAGDSQAHITFTPPQSNGGGAIAGYTATCNPGAIGATGLFSPVTVGGLVNDQTYSCNVRAINSGGESPSSETVSVTPSTSAPMILVGAESKRTHGTAGAFGIPLLITDQASDPFTVEPRMFAEGHEIIFRFSRVVSMPGMVSAQDRNGDAVQATIAGYSGNAVRVSLVGVPNKARLSISLGGVNGSISTAVLMGFLTGDINGSHSVTAADISAVKANNGKPVSSTSFRFDLDGSGVINGADLSFAKARAGTKLD